MNIEWLFAAGFVVIGLFAVVLPLLRSLLHICPPNEVLIFAGRRHDVRGGGTRGFRLLFGGRGWRVPMLESVNRMSLNVQEIPISIRNAYSKGGVPLNVDAIANVKVSSDPATIGNAIERFLGRTGEITRVAKETLEGHLRGVLSTLTPEEVNEDRLKFASSLTKESEDDFIKLGLHLDTLKIQNVSDESGYLNSIGREAIAMVVRNAEIAESDARRDAELAEAEAEGRANVTRENVEAQVMRLNNELRRVQADLEATVRAAEQRTLAAAKQARAEAEEGLQRVRVELEGIRLQADEVLPADAAREEREYRARGEAAAIRERGRAVGQALDRMHGAWLAAGEDSLSIALIEDIGKLLERAAAGVSKVKIENLRMIDGGDGKVLESYLAAYPRMLAEVFKGVAATTGIDIPAVLSGRSPSAVGDASSAQASERGDR